MAVYLRKLMIDNFQAIRDATIKFVPGLNVIVGESDQGKSSILRAIRWVVRDAFRGTWFAKDKTSECRVGVQFQDHIIIREIERVLTDDGKTARLKSNRYIVKERGHQDRIFDKFRELPPEVINTIGISVPVVLGKAANEVIDLNFADQHRDAIFMLDRPGSVLARLLSHVVGLQPIHQAMRELSLRHRRLQQDVRQHQDRQSQLSELVSEFPAEMLQRSFDILDAKVSAVRELGDSYRAIADAYGVWERATERLWEVQMVVEDVDRLVALPWGKVIGQLESFIKLNDCYAIFSKMSADLERLRLYIDKIQVWVERLIEVDGWLEIANNIQFYRQALDRIKQGNNQIDTLMAEVVDIDAEYNKLLEEAGVCPVCGQATGDR